MTTDEVTHSSTPAPSLPAGRRLHDLDALRGFAMLLGIALHASLSFFPGFWVAVDDRASSDGWFDEFFHAVHGFRMPLFFLLSGFFTAMLWRRRGLRRLVEQRALRVALPFAIFVLPIGLVMAATVERATDAGIEDYIEETGDIWTAVFLGNEDAVEALLDRGVDADAPNPAEGGDTPLHVAAFTGDAPMVEVLLERGADPASQSAGGRPIDYAVFVGSADVADLLVDAGADDPRPPGGEWADVSFWAEGAGEAERLQEELGLDPWVGSAWATNLNHLWFLWFLVWLVAGFVAIALVADRVAPGTAAPTRWTGWVMWALIPLTLVPQLQMGDGGAVRLFGPETSTEWLPIWHVLAYYAVFFAFGALLSGRSDGRGGVLVERIGRWWPLLGVGSAATFWIGLDITFDLDRSWFVASVLQVAYTWLTIVALIGVFRAVLGTERRGVRYLSDSAYWLYLAHLPFVVAGQTTIRNWDLPAGVKFVGLTAVTTLLLLASYQLVVRYTPLGTLLNGRRERPRSRAVAEEPPVRTG